MTRAALALLCVAVTGCTPIRRLVTGKPRPSEALYQQALMHLDSTRGPVRLDSAIHYLDRYLVASDKPEHRTEAGVLRHLAANSIALAQVDSALQTRRTDTVRVVDGRREAPPRRDEDATKEIQRLKDELAKANAELERIRKRLANPKDP
jgi:hypothetical protein